MPTRPIAPNPETKPPEHSLLQFPRNRKISGNGWSLIFTTRVFPALSIKEPIRNAIISCWKTKRLEKNLMMSAV
jgi:hypothetical protein